jgi:hypothetical protein
MGRLRPPIPESLRQVGFRFPKELARFNLLDYSPGFFVSSAAAVAPGITFLSGALRCSSNSG